MRQDSLAGLLDSWIVHLEAERKSPATVKSYSDGVRLFLRWCETTGVEAALDRPSVQKWIAELLAAGAEAATAQARLMGVRRFSVWLAEEGEINADELANLRPPKRDRKALPGLTVDQLTALLKTCGTKTFHDRRDEALIRFMAETTARANEVTDMRVADVDVRRGIATIRRGKGGKGRIVAFGPHTGRALDRYLRMRRTHRLAETTALWLGDRGKRLAYAGLHATLTRRARRAGIVDFHPHQLRRTAAVRWLNAGGTVTGLMAMGGWENVETLRPYIEAAKSDLAVEEARRLNLGDL